MKNEIDKLLMLCLYHGHGCEWRGSFKDYHVSTNIMHTLWYSKAVANGPVGQVLAGLLFLKVKTKFHFTKSK